MRNRSSIQVVCAEYERLLTESQVALTRWANTRAGISGRRGRDTYNDLRTLQEDFLKAWALLQDHKRDCEVCQVMSINEAVHSATDTGSLHQLYLQFRRLGKSRG